MESGRALSRRAGIILVVLAAGALFAGCFLPWWQGAAGGLDKGVGLRGLELCAQGGGCRRAGLDALGRDHEAWRMLGATSFAMAWVSAAFLLAAAGLSWFRPAGHWRVRAARGAAVAALFSWVVGAGFAWTYPGFEGLSWGMGLACYLGGAGVAVGAAGILLGRPTIE